MSPRETIYITKHAVSRGILTGDLDNITGGHARASLATDFDRVRECCWAAPDEWFRSLPEAIADAERRRARKIASLEKQLAAVRAIDLTRPLAPTPEQTGGE